MNLDSALYCRGCGKKLNVPAFQPVAGVVGVENSYQGTLLPEALPVNFPNYNTEAQSHGSFNFNTASEYVPQVRESLLEKLDRMEKELETKQHEAIPDSATETPDELDGHEETLKNIAYTLDSLISDLLEAEVREYAFPDFIHPDETGFPLKETNVAPNTEIESEAQKKGRNIQEVLVVAALIAAIFLVGLSFGLWGSVVFGL
jgi:hypothetical protein